MASAALRDWTELCYHATVLYYLFRAHTFRPHNGEKIHFEPREVLVHVERSSQYLDIFKLGLVIRFLDVLESIRQS